MNHTFPTNGTWMSRWHHLYTEVPANAITVTEQPVTVLPQPTDFTTAA